MGDVDVLALAAAVGDADTGIAALREVMVEVRADLLYRVRVYSLGFEGQSDTLYPYACNQLDVEALQESENTVEQADGMVMLTCGATCRMFANFSAP